MNLFDLFATLKLNNSEFEAGIQGAIEQGKSLQEKIDNVDTAALDEEIAALDADIETLENDIDGLSGKSEFVKGAVDGLMNAGLELVQKGLEALSEYALKSLDIAAESGTELGNQLKQAREDWSLTSDVIQDKLGQFLAPAATALTNFGESLLGVTKEEKITQLFEQLDSYAFQNLQTAEQSLRGIFSTFELFEPEEEAASLYDMASALDSQIAYWEEYGRVVEDLRGRGLSDDLLAEYATGEQSSLRTLQTFADASDAELAAISERYAAVESARKEAAAAISAAQLDVDDTVDQITDTIARIGTEVDEGETINATMKVTNGIINTLAAQYPAIASWVDTINAKMGSIMSGVSVGFSGISFGGGSGKRFATGLDYVPHNYYPAYLDEGEAVLTKAEATAWRRGEGQGVDVAGIVGAVVQGVREGLRGLAINMDGHAVGDLVTEQVSRNIAQAAWAGRYSG